MDDRAFRYWRKRHNLTSWEQPNPRGKGRVAVYALADIAAAAAKDGRPMRPINQSEINLSPANRLPEKRSPEKPVARFDPAGLAAFLEHGVATQLAVSAEVARHMPAAPATAEEAEYVTLRTIAKELGLPQMVLHGEIIAGRLAAVNVRPHAKWPSWRVQRLAARRWTPVISTVTP